MPRVPDFQSLTSANKHRMTEGFFRRYEETLHLLVMSPIDTIALPPGTRKIEGLRVDLYFALRSFVENVWQPSDINYNEAALRYQDYTLYSDGNYITWRKRQRNLTIAQRARPIRALPKMRDVRRVKAEIDVIKATMLLVHKGVITKPVIFDVRPDPTLTALYADFCREHSPTLVEIMDMPDDDDPSKTYFTVL